MMDSHQIRLALTSMSDDVALSTSVNLDFEAYYRSIFGKRWPTLRDALMQPSRQVARLTPHHPDPASRLPGRAEPLASSERCLQLEPGSAFESPPRSECPAPYYLLDGASVWAARALDVQPGDRVLDMCAAPGGKTLVLADDMGERGFLVANDRSSSRRARLHDVLESHLLEARRSRIRVTGHDATKWGLHQQSMYDRVLVDAPCSGERHLLDAPDRLREWSRGRPEQMAHRQYPLLCAALDAARVGGRIVYCTCALAPTENDEVIEQLLARSPDRVECLELQLPRGEATEYGWHVLPDTADGWGPLFVAGLERTS